MTEIDYVNVLALALVAVAAPLLVDLLRIPVPDVVAMILAGIALGPSGLGWVEVDVPVEILSALGLAYLLFVSGLEIRVDVLRGGALLTGLWSFGVSVGIALAAAVALFQAGLVDGIGIIVATLITTSLGIVVVVLKDAGRLQTTMGQLTLLGALLGDFASVAILSVLFTDEDSSLAVRLLLLGLFTLTILLLAAAALRMSALERLRRAIARRAGGASQISVRVSFALMVGFAALSQAFGLAAILGAFAAGVAASAISDRSGGTGETRLKLEVVGFGLLAPLFFVTAGLRFDLGALTESASSLVLVPLLLAAMIATRALPTLLFARLIEPREVLASGLLLSTKLTFVVAAVEIGRAAGELEPATASGLVTAAIITVVSLPTAAAWMLSREGAGAGTGVKA